MKKHKIEIAVDHLEGSEFVAWLNKNGHDAAIGSSTGNYVDGEWTSSDDDANQILNNLWDKYCNGSAARTLGSIKSPRKAASSRENGKLGGRPKNGLPKTKQRNLFPGDKTVVFLSDATDDSGVVWPKGSVKTPWSGGFSNEKNCKYQDFTDKTIFYEK